MLLPILTHPHPLLRQKAEVVKNPQDKTTQKLASDMIETLLVSKGVGLAANQVGQTLQIVVIAAGTGPELKEPLALFNTKILRYSWRKTLSEEGCLSLPGVIVKIKRARSIIVQALAKDGAPMKFTARGMLAIVLQHEVDHLNGILIIDKNRVG